MKVYQFWVTFYFYEYHDPIDPSANWITIGFWAHEEIIEKKFKEALEVAKDWAGDKNLKLKKFRFHINTWLDVPDGTDIDGRASWEFPRFSFNDNSPVWDGSLNLLDEDEYFDDED